MDTSKSNADWAEAVLPLIPPEGIDTRSLHARVVQTGRYISYVSFRRRLAALEELEVSNEAQGANNRPLGQVMLRGAETEMPDVAEPAATFFSRPSASVVEECRAALKTTLAHMEHPEDGTLAHVMLAMQQLKETVESLESLDATNDEVLPVIIEQHYQTLEELQRHYRAIQTAMTTFDDYADSL